jgi:hypothetical protein
VTFAFHHPSYYKKLKQNSGSSSKNDVSEDLTPPTMETKVGQVGSLFTPTHTNSIDPWCNDGRDEPWDNYEETK